MIVPEPLIKLPKRPQALPRPTQFRVALALLCAVLTIAFAAALSLVTFLAMQMQFRNFAIGLNLNDLPMQILGMGLVLSVAFGFVCWLLAGWMARPLATMMTLAHDLGAPQTHLPKQSDWKLEAAQQAHSMVNALQAELQRERERESELLDANQNLQRELRQRTLELILTQDSLTNKGEETQRLQDEQDDMMSSLIQLASTDDLTQLLNRRTLYQLGEKEFAAAKRNNNPLAVLMLDIDDFKRINDQFNHAAGDETLQKIANVCRELTRDTDVVGRYGGEEFVFVLPSTTAQDAQAIAERLRNGVIETSQQLSFSNTLQVTASIGIATLAPQDTSFAQLMNRADTAHYVAKQNGKNQICAA